MPLFEKIKQDHKAGNIFAKILMGLDHLIPVVNCERTTPDEETRVARFKILLEESGLEEDKDFFVYKQERRPLR
jgi:hypothetical protein